MRVPYSRLGHPTPTVLQCQGCLGKPKSNEGRGVDTASHREEEAAWVRGGKARPTGLRQDPPCLRYSCLRAHPCDDRALPSFHSISSIRRHRLQTLTPSCLQGREEADVQLLSCPFLHRKLRRTSINCPILAQASYSTDSLKVTQWQLVGSYRTLEVLM